MGSAIALALTASTSMLSFAAFGADQTQVGAGNARAEQIGGASPLVQSAKRLLIENAKKIEDHRLREITLDSFDNGNTYVVHRSGVKAGVFPPIHKLKKLHII
jgi:hypothetical protein